MMKDTLDQYGLLISWARIVYGERFWATPAVCFGSGGWLSADTAAAAITSITTIVTAAPRTANFLLNIS
jgi:hypothetical protein